MSDGLRDTGQQSYTFVVFDPPGPGFPWLSVCLGPNGAVRGCESFFTLAAAQAKTADCAEDFMKAVAAAPGSAVQARKVH